MRETIKKLPGRSVVCGDTNNGVSPLHRCLCPTDNLGIAYGAGVLFVRTQTTGIGIN